MTLLEIYWNKDVDPSQSFKFSGQYSGTSGSATLDYPGQSVQLRIDLAGNNLIAVCQWDEDKQIRMDIDFQLESEASTINGKLSTPFDGYERISFVTVQKNNNTHIDNHVSLLQWFEFL